MARHEILREGLARFESSGGASGTEQRSPRFRESIRDAGRKRRLGSDDGEVRAQLVRYLQDGVRIGERRGSRIEAAGEPGITRCAMDVLDTGIARQPPTEGVLARAGAQD
jgi:hypothetical protein